MFVRSAGNRKKWVFASIRHTDEVVEQEGLTDRQARAMELILKSRGSYTSSKGFRLLKVTQRLTSEVINADGAAAPPAATQRR